MVKGGTDTEEEDRLIGLRFPYSFDEEIDGLSFVRLHNPVVLG